MPYYVSKTHGCKFEKILSACDNSFLLFLPHMKTVDDFNFAGKKVLVRVDFNVPLDREFHITDDKRIRAAIPTIKKILNDGGAAILMSHHGRPKSGPEEKFSLK